MYVSLPYAPRLTKHSVRMMVVDACHNRSSTTKGMWYIVTVPFLGLSLYNQRNTSKIKKKIVLSFERYFPVSIQYYYFYVAVGTYLPVAFSYHIGEESNAGWKYLADQLARSGVFTTNDNNSNIDIGEKNLFHPEKKKLN